MHIAELCSVASRVARETQQSYLLSNNTGTLLSYLILSYQTPSSVTV